MKRKILSVIIALIVIGAFVANHLVIFAQLIRPILYVNLTATDKDQVGYGIGDPDNGGEYIWNITSYDENAIPTEEQKNLYCVNADYGDSWFGNTEQTGDESQILDYELYYDIQTDRGALLANLQNDTNNMIANLLNPDGSQYRQLLWLFDNAFIIDSKKTDDKIAIDVEEYLTQQLGIVKNGTTYYYGQGDDAISGSTLPTAKDIIAIQKMAVWYFTNRTEDPTDEDTYDKTAENQGLWLNVITSEDTQYNEVTGFRNDLAMVLYRHLISSAKDGASQYTSANNYKLDTVPASVNTQGLTPIVTSENENDKYIVNMSRDGADYLIGPIIIEENNELEYDLDILVNDQKGNTLDEADYKYIYIDENNNKSEKTEAELVDLTGGFYVSVPTNKVNSVNISITVSYTTTTKTLWLDGEEAIDGKITLNAEQPLVEIKQDKPDITIELISEPEFDLALRKYITALHDKDGNEKEISNVRNLNNISLDTLTAQTTATYKHRKDPVVVEDGDEVTYTLRIYNEGNKAGYAKKIIDQLPEGLRSSTNNSSIVESKGPDGQIRNQYKLDYYINSNNQIELTLIPWSEELEQNALDNVGHVNDIQPYTEGNLDYEEIEIKCMVAEEADTEKQIILTNIAWIAQAYDSEAQQEISSNGTTDRDSSPSSSPSVSQANMSSYRGSTTENELTSNEYFYAGQEDDDDFEKLVIKPVVKKFDLELVKFIAAVSDDEIIEDGEYLTDTKNADGKYERAPKISIVQEQDSEDRRIYCDWSPSNKNPVLVEEGDYVLYTIRVYNAGELDGYAAEIKDHLPVGLEFVDTTDGNAEYYGIWNLDTIVDQNGDEKQVVSTNYLAKGQGAEYGTTQGQVNYTANLLRALNTDPDVGVLDGETRNPDYRDVQVLCRVTSDAQKDGVLINFAQISKDTDKDGNEVDENGNDIIVDEDSVPGNLPETGPHEDDEDLERVRLQHFDLSLRKFITSVDGNEISTRIPNEDTTPLISGEDTAEYNHTKQPVEVQIGDEVIYTIRVYNEGTIDGFASEITDYLPKYLKYDEDSEINKEYGWQVSEDGRIAITTYLADTELKAFAGGEDLNYAEVKIACIVSKDAPVKEVQTNIAEISEYKYNGVVVTKDIDSTSDNMILPTDANLPSYKQDELDKEYVPGNEDDDDFEKIYVKPYDLSLRKFIISVDGKEISTRTPEVDTTPLKNGEDTAIYKHSKQPIAVKIGDNIVYTIRVYNEGKVDGIASEVKDYLPKYLKYDEDSEINKEYEWQISDDGRIATTTYLADTEIKAFDGGDDLDFADVKIECIVSEDAPVKEVQTNIAEISEYTFNDIVVENDSDSEADNMVNEIPNNEELPSYKQDQLDKEYVPGNEDDDDFEKIYVKQFDLALRKFITKIKDTEVTSRVPQVDVTPLTKGEDTAIYEHSKDPLTVHVGDVVIYTIRVYNEGEIAGYASEITDDIPEYLEYLPEDTTNVKYMWKMYDENGNETDNVEEAVSVKTTYLSKENEKTAGENLIKAFDGKTLDCKEVEVAFKVKDPNSNKHIITNCAQVSEDTDENGNSVNDKDSDTEKWNDGEDDQDVENVKVEYFDLSLLKFVSKVIVIEDGKEKISETGYNGHEDPEPVVKVELHKKKLSDVIVKFGYGITITNEGDIAGYATEITDYVPEGLKFEAKDNPNWKDEGNNVISTKQLENTLLQPGESKTIEVIFTWINSADNLAQKTNTAEISEDKNEYDVPDRDSTPDNKVEGEDDIDIAKVILAVATGRAKTYFTLTLGLLAVIATGVILIKKFVI